MIATGCNLDKIRIQRTGIPTSEFRYRPRTVPDDGQFRLLEACRLVEKKGDQIMLRAFAKVVQRRPDCRFVIAGDGPVLGAPPELTARLWIGSSVEISEAV